MSSRTSYCLFVLFFFFSLPLFAQNNKGNLKVKKEDHLNKTDKYHQKQGLWYIKKEELRGEPAYTTFGNYEDNKKQGLWYKLDKDGQLISIENFRNGLLNGNAQYYENGHLSVIGNYRSLEQNKQLDSIWVTDPITLYDTLVVIPSETGFVKHGLWRYYNPLTGQLISEETYQIDQLLKKVDYSSVSNLDSTFIKKRIESMPHNKYPKNKNPEGKKPESALYPQLNRKR